MIENAFDIIMDATDEGILLDAEHRTWKAVQLFLAHLELVPNELPLERWTVNEDGTWARP